VRWVGRTTEKSLSQTRKGLTAENELAETGEPIKDRFIDLAQVAFWPARRQKMSSQGDATP
jgi:hypothetical protein